MRIPHLWYCLIMVLRILLLTVLTPFTPFHFQLTIKKTFRMKKITCASLLIILCSFFIFSCNKNLTTRPTDVVAIEESAPNKNQLLIQALINGQQFKITHTSNSAAASLSHSTDQTGGGYTLTLVDKMLHFGSSDELKNFLAATDSVVAQWDSSNDIELEGLETEKSLAGDPALNNFDSTLGFHSLRKKYEMLFYDDQDYADTMSSYIDDIELQTVLNENYEIQIGDTIYKYISRYTLAKISNSDYNALAQLRSNQGKLIDHPHVKYFDPISNTEYIRQIIAGPQGDCIAFFDLPKVETDQQDPRRKTIRFHCYTYNPSGALYLAVISVGVNWGDGSSSVLNPGVSLTELSFTHTYNVNPPPGDCQSFTISLSGTVIASSPNVCPGTTIVPPTPFPINVCGVIKGCIKENKTKETEPALEFTYGGINYRIVGEIGAIVDKGIFNRNMIWSRTYWQKQRNGRWYPTSNKKVRLVTVAYNNYYTNDCSTPNNFRDEYGHFNQVHVTSKYHPRESYGWVPQFADGIRSDHYVRIVEKGGNVVEYSILGHYLR